jgi:hypothetical protein
MHAHGKSIVTPTLRQQDADMQARCSLCSLLTQQRVATSQPLRRPSRGWTSYQAGSYSVLLLISFLRCFLKPETLLKSSGMCFGAIAQLFPQHFRRYIQRAIHSGPKQVGVECGTL